VSPWIVFPLARGWFEDRDNAYAVVDGRIAKKIHYPFLHADFVLGFERTIHKRLFGD